MLDQFRQKARRLEEVDRLLQDPAAVGDFSRSAALTKERGQLLKTLGPYLEYEKIQKDLEGARALLSDPDLKADAEKEVAELEAKGKALHAQLEELALSSDGQSARIWRFHASTSSAPACCVSQLLSTCPATLSAGTPWDAAAFSTASRSRGSI